MRFTKMQGLGNDYVYVNCFKEKIADPSALAVKISDRHFGVGSDGLIMINPSDKADFEMEMYNADGSRGEMCGNGIRCVAKYVYDYGLTDKTHISVETLGGIKYLDLTVEDGKVKLVKVDMGKPELEPERVPVKAEGDRAVDAPILVDGEEYRMTCVSMGNPHAVVFVDCDVKEFPLETVGPKFENHERFPNRVNTEFVRVIDSTTIKMRVYEKVCGETFACGTGACAAVVAACENGYCEKGKDITVKLNGGDLVVNYKNDGVTLSGDAKFVYDGVTEY